MSTTDFVWAICVISLLPIIASFSKSFRFVGMKSALFIAIGVPAAFFLIGDIVLLVMDIWSFKTAVFLGPFIQGFPVDRLLFYIFPSFCFLFLFELTIHKNMLVLGSVTGKWLVLLLAAVFMGIGMINQDKLMTFYISCLAGGYMSLQIFFYRATFVGRYLTVLIFSIPFLLLFSGLISNWGEEESMLVDYEEGATLQWSFMGVKMEEFAYWILLSLMNTTFYEKVKPFLSENARSMKKNK